MSPSFKINFNIIISIYNIELLKDCLMGPQEKINEVIAEKLGVDIKEVVPEAHIIDDLGADSLDVVELIMSLEEELNVEISDEEAEQLTTVQSIYNFIKNNVSRSKWDAFNE